MEYTTTTAVKERLVTSQTNPEVLLVDTLEEVVNKLEHYDNVKNFYFSNERFQVEIQVYPNKENTAMYVQGSIYEFNENPPEMNLLHKMSKFAVTYPVQSENLNENQYREIVTKRNHEAVVLGARHNIQEEVILPNGKLVFECSNILVYKGQLNLPNDIIVFYARYDKENKNITYSTKGISRKCTKDSSIAEYKDHVLLG